MSQHQSSASTNSTPENDESDDDDRKIVLCETMHKFELEDYVVGCDCWMCQIVGKLMAKCSCVGCRCSCQQSLDKLVNRLVGRVVHETENVTHDVAPSNLQYTESSESLNNDNASEHISANDHDDNSRSSTRDWSPSSFDNDESDDESKDSSSDDDDEVDTDDDDYRERDQECDDSDNSSDSDDTYSKRIASQDRVPSLAEHLKLVQDSIKECDKKPCITLKEYGPIFPYPTFNTKEALDRFLNWKRVNLYPFSRNLHTMGPKFGGGTWNMVDKDEDPVQMMHKTFKDLRDWGNQFQIKTEKPT